MFQTISENLWHIGLIAFLPVIKPKYRKLYALMILFGAAYHIYRSNTWRGHV